MKQFKPNVFQGMGNQLDLFDMLIIEVSSIPVYAGQKKIDDIEALIFSQGFYCHAGCEPCEHCDRFYKRT